MDAKRMRIELKAFVYLIELEKIDLLSAENVTGLIEKFEQVKKESPELAERIQEDVEALNFLLNKLLKVVATAMVQDVGISLLYLNNSYLVLCDETEVAKIEKDKRDVAIDVYLKTIQKEILKWA